MFGVTCYCGSISPISPIVVFVAILLLLSVEPTTPVPSWVASQWRERPSSSNGDHNSGEMAGAPPVRRRARTTRKTPSDYVRTTLLFGAHSSSRLLVASVLRQLVHDTWTTPQRKCPSPTHQTCSLRAQPACCTLPASRCITCTSPRAASTSPKIARRPVLVFLLFGAEGYARRATDKHVGIIPSRDQRQGVRLLREPIGQHTPLLTEPDRPSRDLLGLRAPLSRSSCRVSFLMVFLGGEQAVLAECLGYLVWRLFEYTRYRMGFSTCTSLYCASDKL